MLCYKLTRKLLLDAAGDQGVYH
uniref:Uncharacterized protein n=1 Tax=Anguilla anguilla TaxID=7936 RepID=A0A0E9QBH3_ANGAN